MVAGFFRANVEFNHIRAPASCPRACGALLSRFPYNFLVFSIPDRTLLPNMIVKTPPWGWGGGWGGVWVLGGGGGVRPPQSPSDLDAPGSTYHWTLFSEPILYLAFFRAWLFDEKADDRRFAPPALPFLSCLLFELLKDKTAGVPPTFILESSCGSNTQVKKKEFFSPSDDSGMYTTEGSSKEIGGIHLSLDGLRLFFVSMANLHWPTLRRFLSTPPLSICVQARADSSRSFRLVNRHSSPLCPKQVFPRVQVLPGRRSIASSLCFCQLLSCKLL